MTHVPRPSGATRQRRKELAKVTFQMGPASPHGQELIFHTEPPDNPDESQYRPLVFSAEPASRPTVRHIAESVLNWNSTEDWPASKWKRARPIRYKYNHNGQNFELPPFTFDELCDDMAMSHGIERFRKLVERLEINWLDMAGISITQNFAGVAKQTGEPWVLPFVYLPFGNSFPCKPAVDREGFMISSMVSSLQGWIVSTRSTLVETSNEMFVPDSPWLQKLVSYLNALVAVVECTLISLYYRAKYGGDDSGFILDEKKIPSTATQRMDEKIKWIGWITGRPLDDAPEEIAAFKKIKAVRNHLNHFDPPCFAATIEDVAEWLNATQMVGRLQMKMRDKMDLPLSRGLIKVALAKQVVPVPRSRSLVRPPQGSNAGYASCILQSTAK